MTLADIPTQAEVVIAGGGPAGASAAIALCGLGHQVVVLERLRFPRFRIGESLPPRIVPLFAILGVDRAIDSAGFVRMAGTTVYQGDEILTHDFAPDGRQLGYQVDRARFDAILLDRARSAGASVFESTAVASVLKGEGGKIEGVRARENEGSKERETEIRSRFVVDCTGSAGVLSRSFGWRRRESIRTVALSGYWTGSSISDDFPATNTLFEMQPDGWLWSVLLGDGRRNVTLGLDTGALKATQAAKTETYMRALEASRLIGPLLKRATLIAELSAHDATWFFSERHAGDGFLVCGDAGSFIDPLTSQGVYKAMHSGIVASAVINTVSRRLENAAIALEHFEERETRAHQSYSEIALSFYRSSPYAHLPFWQARTRSDLFPSATSFEALSATEQRRNRFIDRVRIHGGRALRIRAKAELLIADRAVVEGGFIVMRPALVSSGPSGLNATSDRFGVDLVRFRGLLDGRTMSEVFESYIEGGAGTRSSDQGKALMEVLVSLAEKDLIEVEGPEKSPVP